MPAVLLNKTTMLSLRALGLMELFCESKARQKIDFRIDFQIKNDR
jgi:hypothetical protein